MTFLLSISNTEFINNLRHTTIISLIFKLINGFVGCKMEQGNSQCDHRQPVKQTILFCRCQPGVDLPLITATVSILVDYYCVV